MAAARRSQESSKRRPAATTPEGRENQLISMAHDLAEKRIREGTASAQEIVHFLKLGSTREQLEQQRLAMDIQVSQAKIEAMGDVKRSEEIAREAMDAFRAYSGQPPIERGDD